MPSTNKVLKKIFNVNKIKICNCELYKDHKGQDHLKISVDLRKSEKNRCPFCHKKCMSYDSPDYKRVWRHLDLGGIVSEIEMEAHRIECKKHGILCEAVPFAYEGSKFTKDFDLTVAFFARNVSKSFVSEYMRISWSTIGRCISRARKDLDPDLRRRLDNLVNIGIDETSYKSGHKYITVIVNHDTGEVVWLHKDHGKQVLKTFFESLSDEQKASIKAISGDGARWIDECIDEYVPSVTRCTDAYHTVGWAQEALDEVRAEAWHKANDEVKKDKKTYSRGRPAKDDKERARTKEKKEYAKAIKNSRYALGKNPENLTAYQETKLQMIAESEPRLFRAYRLKEDLRLILHLKDVSSADQLLKKWLWKASHSKIKPFVELSRKIRRHKGHILNTIEYGLSNARIEAVNNKIKLIIRRAYGFRNLDNMFDMIYLCCSNIEIPLPNRAIKSEINTAS
ncbi:MAG: ISL3 family transposase [Erysipelotrichaceae bacterium]|nr:ISL3 family transposase [Erysipelotrichaceae bacterium]